MSEFVNNPNRRNFDDFMNRYIMPGDQFNVENVPLSVNPSLADPEVNIGLGITNGAFIGVDGNTYLVDQDGTAIMISTGGGGGSGWLITGNAGTDGAGVTNYVGTSDNQDMKIGRNARIKLRFDINNNLVFDEDFGNIILGGAFNNVRGRTNSVTGQGSQVIGTDNVVEGNNGAVYGETNIVTGNVDGFFISGSSNYVGASYTDTQGFLNSNNVHAARVFGNAFLGIQFCSGFDAVLSGIGLGGSTLLFLDGNSGTKQILLPSGGFVSGFGSLNSVATTSTGTVNAGDLCVFNFSFAAKYDGTGFQFWSAKSVTQIEMNPFFKIGIQGSVTASGGVRLETDVTVNDGAEYYSVLRITGVKGGQ